MRDDEPRPSGGSVMRISAEIWRLFVDRIPGAWMTEEPAAVAVVTGLDSPTENGVLVLDRGATAPDVERLLDRVAATDLPHHLQLRDRMGAAVLEIPHRRGMELEAEEPAMILTDFSALHAAAQVRDLTLRTLPPGRIEEHVEVVGEVFGSPRDVVEALMNPAVMSHPGIRCYSGEVDGEPVCTGVGITHCGAVAIFSVATRPALRGRGYGAALTARAVLDGAASGARWAWLQSDPAAARLYARLGFVDTETHALWTVR